MRVLLTAALAAGAAVAISGSASAQTKSPIFGGAAVQVTTAAQNKDVVGKGYYANLYGYYGNYYSNLASQYGLYGSYYQSYSYYNSAQNYAYDAYTYYGYASTYQKAGQ